MNKKILLIDDSKTQLKTHKILLEHQGFDVETATNGIEGYQKLFETAPDIIISDIIMPSINGYQLCRLIKDNPLTKNIPIILLTILEEKIDKFWSKKSGADLFLQKSTDTKDIIKAINQLLSEKQISEEDKAQIRKKSFPVSEIQSEINHILDNSLMYANILNEFRLLALHLENDEVMAQNLFELLSSVLNFDLALLILSPPAKTEKEVYSSYNLDTDDNYTKSIIQKTINSIFGNNTDCTIKKIQTDDTKPITLTKDILGNTYFHRIIRNNEILGAICFFSTQDKTFQSEKLFNIALNEINLLITVQSLYAQNKYLSFTDGLTGLYSRRYLLETLEREHARAQRYNQDLSLVLFDIDFFKKINDTHGHQAGDFMLKSITGIIKNMLRKNDIIFRYGGEEVLVIMPETSKEQALIPIERIRKYIEGKEFKYKDIIIKTTISIGISDIAQNPKTLEMFIENSDKAMYEAKKMGRNRVVIFNE